MASTDVVVRFIGDTSKLRDDVAKVQGTGSKVKTWAKGVGAAIGGAFVAKQVVDMVRAASDLNETMNKTNTVFGEGAGAVSKWSESAAEAMGLSQQEALAAASGFGTLFNQLGFGANASKDMSTGLVQASADIASFHNVAGGAAEVSQLMSSAFIGEYDALQKYIPTINAAAVEQQAMTQTGKKTAKQLTASEKAAATYSLILEGMGPAAGDFAKTSDEMANSQRTTSAEWKDAQAALGQGLIPVVTKITQVLTKLVSWMSENTGAVYVFAAAVTALGIAVLIATHPVAAIVIAIAALIAGLVWAYQNVEVFRTIVQTAFQALLIVFKVWWAYVSTIFKLWVAAFKAVWAGLQPVFRFIGAAFEKVKAVATTVVNGIRTVWNGLVGFISSMAARISGLVGGIVRAFNSIKDAASAVYSWVRSKFQAIVDFIRDVAHDMGVLAGRIVDAVKAPINAVIRAWNSFKFPTFSIPKVSTPLGDIGGGSWGGWHLPHIPELDTGGFIRRTGIALVHQGETVVPKGAGGPVNITINTTGLGADAPQIQRAVVNAIRGYVSRNGPLTTREQVIAL